MKKDDAIEILNCIRMTYICDEQECGCKRGDETCKMFKCDEKHEALVMAINTLKGTKC